MLSSLHTGKSSSSRLVEHVVNHLHRVYQSVLRAIPFSGCQRLISAEKANPLIALQSLDCPEISPAVQNRPTWNCSRSIVSTRNCFGSCRRDLKTCSAEKTSLYLYSGSADTGRWLEGLDAA